jgi:hypothetical protein
LFAPAGTDVLTALGSSVAGAAPSTEPRPLAVPALTGPARSATTSCAPDPHAEANSNGIAASSQVGLTMSSVSSRYDE